MRTTYSPERGSKIPIPPKPKYSLCFVTYLGEHGWYDQRPRIRDISIRTMVEGLGSLRSECEVIIWDNNGTDHVSPIAHYADYMIYSPNICNWNARRNMLDMARGDIVSLTDDDILFSPGWLEQQAKVLESFPNTEFVHGAPSKCRNRDFRNRKWAFDHAKVITTTLPESWQTDFYISRGMPDRKDRGNACLCEYAGARGWVCALDQQFLGHKDVLRKFYDHESPILFDTSQLNERVAQAGYMTLSTEKRTGIHIGNVIDDTVIRAAEEMGVSL